ncbi:mgtC family protein, partial [Yersinia pestis PY-52]
MSLTPFVMNLLL